MRSIRFWLAAVAILSGAAFAISRVGGDAPAAIELAALRLEVDLSARRLSVIEGGEVVTSYPVAIGQPSYPTPKGSFRIRRIIWNPRWVPPDAPWARKKKATPPGHPDNPMGKVKIFFSEPDYYIHGTRFVDSLGEAESHGCLRMRNPDVIALARRVMAAGGKPVSQSWVRRVINKIRSTREVRLSSPVGITIKG
ncbi:MAG: L,D-transpeptidase [Gemmatimonadota bacterium]